MRQALRTILPDQAIQLFGDAASLHGALMEMESRIS